MLIINSIQYFHYRISVSLDYETCVEVAGHTLNISSLCNDGEWGHLSTHTCLKVHTHTHILFSPPDNSRTDSMLINLQQQHTQNTNYSRGKQELGFWKSRWKLKKNEIQERESLFFLTFSISLRCALNYNLKGITKPSSAIDLRWRIVNTLRYKQGKQVAEVFFRDIPAYADCGFIWKHLFLWQCPKKNSESAQLLSPSWEKRI